MIQLFDQAISSRESRSILRADLVVIDELGCAPLDLFGANHLFRFISAAYETRSLVVTCRTGGGISP